MLSEKIRRPVKTPAPVLAHPDADEFVDTVELARRISVRPRTVPLLAKRGYFPMVRLNGHLVRFYWPHVRRRILDQFERPREKGGWK
jgi:hypothetical protein